MYSKSQHIRLNILVSYEPLMEMDDLILLLVSYLPFGEQSDGSLASTCSVLLINSCTSSLKPVLRVWKPVLGIAGFSEGRWRTKTHRQTSNVANTTLLPGSMCPSSPPSPNTVCCGGCGLLGGSSETSL